MATDSFAVSFHDRLDRTYTLDAHPGENIRTVLARNHIPCDAVIVSVDGSVVDDRQARLEPQGHYRIDMVRAYHLPDLLGLAQLWDPHPAPDADTWLPDPSAYYTKRLLWSAGQGDYDSVSTPLGKEQFVSEVERTFVEGVLSKGLIEGGDELLLPISGGRDSLSLGYLLARNRHHLPSFHVRAVHIETVATPLDTSFAKILADQFEYPLIVVTDADAAAIFNLRESPRRALEGVRSSFDEACSIVASHAIMRGCVEEVARKHGISKIAYGLMRDDLTASVVKGAFVGFPFDGAYRKAQGEFDLVYPLWPLSKKELTLYLDAITPPLNRQGSPPPAVRGSLARDVYYLITDTIEALAPGASLQLLAAHEREVSAFIQPRQYRVCENCRSTHTEHEKSSRWCYVCWVFGELGLLS